MWQLQILSYLVKAKYSDFCFSSIHKSWYVISDLLTIRSFRAYWSTFFLQVPKPQRESRVLSSWFWVYEGNVQSLKFFNFLISNDNKIFKRSAIPCYYESKLIALHLYRLDDFITSNMSEVRYFPKKGQKHFLICLNCSFLWSIQRHRTFIIFHLVVR